jgi:hypothetical protein
MDVSSKMLTTTKINPDYITYWAKDIPCMIRDSPTSGKWRHCDDLRIVLESNLNTTFPQSHRVMMSTPLEDLFFHWTFICSPFSFKTLAQKMKWEIANLHTAGDNYNEEFKKFGYTVKHCVEKCSRFPETAKAHLTIDTENGVAQLKFTEIVQKYRAIELLTLEFIPSDWNMLKLAVLDDYLRIQKEYETLQTNLIHVLDTVARNQPSILLLKSLDDLPIPSYQPLKIRKIMDMVAAKTTDSAISRLKQKESSSDAFENVPISHLLMTKSIPVTLIDPLKKTEEVKILIFTFHSLVFSKFHFRDTDNFVRTPIPLPFLIH